MGMKIMNRNLRIIKILIYIIIVCIFAYYMVSNYKLFCIASGSMKPSLNVNDLVVVKENCNYSYGDIITFFDDDFNGYVTHRIIGSENERFITKGDSNNTEDKNKVNTNQIVGKVVFKSSLLGLILYKYRITTMVVLILILFLNKFWREVRNE